MQTVALVLALAVSVSALPLLGILDQREHSKRMRLAKARARDHVRTTYERALAIHRASRNL